MRTGSTGEEVPRTRDDTVYARMVKASWFKKARFFGLAAWGEQCAGSAWIVIAAAREPLREPVGSPRGGLPAAIQLFRFPPNCPCHRSTFRA